jgi:membrane-bound ClpP family serine protease
MFAFLKLQPSVPSSVSRSADRSASRKLYDTLSSVPTLPSEDPSARVECTVSRYEFGRVVFEGVSWRAKCIQNRSYGPGDRVKVLYRQDNALWVDTLFEQ